MARVGLSADLREFADATFAAAGAATSTGPTTAFGVLGQAVSVRFAGTPLHDALAPAWAALPEAGEAEPLVVHVLDREAAGDPPPPPWPADAYRPRDEVAGFGEEPLEVAYQLTTGTLMLWDAAARRGLWWTRSAAAEVPVWERAMPLRVVLRWALRGAGIALVHGAAVGDGGAMALLVGPGGSGKSTLALAAQAAGWHYVADDYCAVDPATLRVAPVTSFAKATDGTLALLPGLAVRAGGPRTPDDKHVIATTPDPAGQVGAVVLPRVSAAAEPPVRVPAARTMASLAPTSLLQMPGSRDRDRDLLAGVVRAVPGFALASGPDPDVTLRHLSALLRSS
jgi:hypothetical protein